MTMWQDKVAVITGGASGFGLETARLAARQGMRVVLADVQHDALEMAQAEIRQLGAEVLARRVNVADGHAVEALAAATLDRFGCPHFVFNNAGVGSGGLVWEPGAKDWEWLFGVNVMGVAHGVRVFAPRMLDAARVDPAFRGHIVNTASMAGLLNPPNMGLYNASKAAVVSLSETLYHDLSLVTDRVRAHLLCPYFVPTAICHSERNRPQSLAAGNGPTRSQEIARAMTSKAVASGKVSAAQVAQLVFDAMAADRFYIYSHPKALGGVQTLLEDRMLARNPSDPFADRPELGAQLREALRQG